MEQYNQHLPALPKHLLDYIVDQNYHHYTSIDQAVWRYVMRQNFNYLPSVCHGSYVDGLQKAGLSIDTIPSMYGMSRILKDIGWYAVAVDGFIPPTIFMEFQAHNVLVIAADIRKINHIGYTPAPDILHEAAGHAPIIADSEYSNYLKKFGEIGAKAFSSAEDVELFEAIRELSILKEASHINKKLIIDAEHKVNKLQGSVVSLSEMAKIRNLHWWTVEYGLIGTINEPKIYGAGLLSSISESVNCLSDRVKKIRYSISASEVVFDITKEQPQLFVANDFQHLDAVLEDFANKMAFRRGGLYGLNLAINSNQIATCELDTGIQISGVFTDYIDTNNKIIYIKTNGPTALSYKNKELNNHSIKYHTDGFGAPLGLIKNHSNINSLKDKLNKKIQIIYDSGIKLQGELISFLDNEHGNILILTLSNCKMVLNRSHKEEIILFDPSWGNFDLVIGQSIVSSYPNAADRQSFPKEMVSFKTKTIHSIYTDAEKKLHSLYAKIRDMRDNNNIDLTKISDIFNIIRSEFPNDWLLTLEICELVNSDLQIYKDAYNHLMDMVELEPSNKKLILDGLNIIK